MTRSSPPVNPAAPTWGALTLLESIESDATSEVWHAREPAHARDVTLRLFNAVEDPDAAWRRLMDEGKRLARVTNPHLAEFYAMERHDDRIGVWTEWVGGGSLDALVRARGALRVDEAATIGVLLCRGLAALHAAGAVHGDVQAAHVLRAEDGRVVLTGYGLGRRVVDPVADVDAPVAGGASYRAPELLAGLPPTPAADLYGVGVLLWYLVTGTFPVTAPTIGTLTARLTTDGAPSLRALRPDLPVAFSAVVDRALQRLAPGRFRNAREMEAALAAALAAEGAPAPAAGAALSSGATTRRGPGGGIFLLLGAAGIMLMAFFVVLYLSRSARFVPTFDVEAGFVRQVGELAEPLADGAAVRPGDHLRLRFRGSRMLFVYVMAEARDGAAWLVFPRFDGIPQNPLSPGRLVELPGGAPGVENAWTVTQAGERRRFLVAVSAAPLADFEALLAERPPEAGGRAATAVEAGPAPYAGAIPVPAEAMQRLQAAALLPAPAAGAVDGTRAPEAPAAEPLYDLARDLGGREVAARGVWLRRIAFEGAAP